MAVVEPVRTRLAAWTARELAMASKPAEGTPTNIIPRPPSMAWMNAIPITPTATLPIVETDMSSIASPCCSVTRFASFRRFELAPSAFIRNAIAIRNEIIN